MKKALGILGLVMLTGYANGQEKMYIHQTSGVSAGVSMERVDTVKFSSDGAKVYFVIDDETYTYGIGKLDSLSFGDDAAFIDIIYSGESVKVINPLAFDGVSAVADGADLTITAEADSADITYRLSGSSTNGMFKLYSDKRFNLVFNGLSLSNDDGPAINIQSGKKGTITLESGTVNTLSDGSDYSDPVLNSEGEEEDQDAAFFSEGKLIFTGSGALSITGKGSEKHALASDDYIEVESGTLTINSAVKDGIHGKDGVTIKDGTITVSASGDGIDGDEGAVLVEAGTLKIHVSSADTKGISCDSTITISGGTTTITVDGDQSKGISAKQDVILDGGKIVLNTAGDVILESSGSGYDPSYCTAIKSDETLYLNGADISITATGKAGKGLSSDSRIEINGGAISISTSGSGGTYTNSLGSKDSYHGSCIRSNGDIVIMDGNISLAASGSGGKGISADGALTIGSAASVPGVSINTSGSKITVVSGTSGPSGSSGEYDESKAITCDGTVDIVNGTLTISSADDGIKSATAVNISTASLTISQSVEAIESPRITVNSGTLRLYASDDGFNATYGNGGESNDGSLLTINGGTIMVNTSGGDGIDSNGSFAMTGGTVVVHGPQSSPEVGMDVNGTKNVNGGILLISGTNSSNTEAPSTTSSQYSVQAMSSVSLAANTLFHVEDSNGNSIFTFQPVRSYYSVIFSTADLQYGQTYKIYTGGTSTGTNTDGLITGGTYSGGSLKKTFSISSKVTTLSF